MTVGLLVMLDDKNNKYGLLTKREVKMAGYWTTSFFFFHEKETRPISSHLDRTRLVNKGIFYMPF